MHGCICKSAQSEAKCDSCKPLRWAGFSAQALAVRVLLAHRLSGESPEAAKADWYEVVEGDHALWKGVSEPYKHTIRAFLVYFHTQILRHSTERFNFRNGSVGKQPITASLTCTLVGT